MKRYTFTFILFLISAKIGLCQEATGESSVNVNELMRNVFKRKTISSKQLKNRIHSEFAAYPEAAFAVAYRDIETGDKFTINEHESFHAASTMKTPVLVEAFKQAADDKISLDDSILVQNSFKSIVDGSMFAVDSADDSEKDLYNLIGFRVSVRDILFRMITRSSNLATNMIMEKLGAENVSQTMHHLGAKDIRVLRGVEDIKAFEQGLNNTATANDLAVIFEKIAMNQMVSAEASEEMIEILMSQHHKNIIGGKLPPDVKVASKSGSITSVCHDSGIVFLPDGRKYVVVLLTRGIEDHKAASQLLSNVSKHIYEFNKSKHKSPK
ncbi:serine hydrolase [Arcticibacter sp.]|uniref:serine hydrolase n=1 Tax=Arcticibacter sp. TaxID=1872630 RepID=UPI0038903764